MAEWQTPKTDWNVESVPGPGDFRRIEGNTQYLKGQTDGLKNGSVKAGLAKTAENANKLGDYTPNDIKKLTQLGYAIRIAGTAQAGTSYTNTDYYFKWRSAYAVGKKVYFEANVYMPNPQGNERSYAQLYNYTTGTTIVEISINTDNIRNIVTSPAISIPDGAIIGVRLRRGSTGTVHMKGAWLVIL